MDVSFSPRRKFASAVVLFVLTLERLAYYALVSTFYLFLNKGPWSTKEAWDSLDALNAVYILLAVSYISALLGGYISDAWIGRFRTIVCGMILYIIGYVLLILITVDKLPRNICSMSNNYTIPDLVSASNSSVTVDDNLPQAPCKPVVYVALVMVSTGVGMVRANIGPFGAEQLGPSNPGLARSFFNWYYWCANVGSVVGIGVLAFIEQDGPGICSNGFFCGYIIATSCLGLALVVLLALYPLFERHPAAGSSPLFNIFRITWEATRLKFRDLRTSRQQVMQPPPLVKPRFLDLAKVRYGGRYHETAVDDVRAVGSMLALFASLLPYWLVYFQMQTSFQAQGLHMRFMLDSDGHNNSSALSTEREDPLVTAHGWKFSVPAAWLTMFNQAFLIIALPLLTKFVYPYLDREGIRFSMLARIGVGMFVSCLAMMTAGGLETFRLALWKMDNSTHIIQTVGNVSYNAVDISIFWQVPQYMLVAAAEALASIAGLEYAYSEAPRSFQSLIMGLFYAMEGVGSFLGIALLQLVARFWFNNTTDYGNINENHLDFFLYFLGVIQMVMLIVYGVTIYVSRFSLELVPLPSDEGIGGPLDRRFRRHSRSRRARAAAQDSHSTNYRELQEDTYEDRLRQGHSANSGAILDADGEDAALINVAVDDDASPPHHLLKDDVMAVEDSDDSLAVNDTPTGAAFGGLSTRDVTPK